MRFPKLLGELSRLVFPSRCQICRKFCDTAVCVKCRQSFEELGPPLCVLCGVPMGADAPVHADECAECRHVRRRLTAVRSFGEHRADDGVLRGAVNGLKFHGNTRLAGPLGELLAPMLNDAGYALYLPGAATITHIVPVPLHENRRRERGFNQAELLADVLAEAVGLPVRASVLTRTRDTRPQVSLTAAQRAVNVRNAFSLTIPVRLSSITALLVDDVYTTGATLEECARTLLRGGADAVYAVTVTRRLRDD